MTVKETGADIRRFIVASLDSFASRIVTDFVTRCRRGAAGAGTRRAAARRPKRPCGVGAPRRRGAHPRHARCCGRDARI